MAEKHQELNPSDARIYIDYSKGKPKVSFEYPDKQNTFNIVLSTIFALWKKIMICFVILNLPLLIIYKWITYVSLEGVFVSSQSLFPTILSFIIIMGLIFTFLLGIVPIIVSCIICNNKKLLKLMPELGRINAVIEERGYYHYRFKKAPGKEIFISTFGNIFMDYKATKDFKKYLKKVSIEEHSNFAHKVKIFGKEEKDFVQTDFWFLVFEFKKEPKSGYLDVKYL